MAIKFLAITLFFGLAVIKPVHDTFPENDHNPKLNKTLSDATLLHQHPHRSWNPANAMEGFLPTPHYEADYLWMYLAFAYFFTGLALYLIISETRKIIEVRQDYLGSQVTVTDRTIRLSGIPHDLRSEERIKEFIEYLEIGKVESVLLCKDWKELDNMMVKRITILRRLEEAWTVYLGHRRVERSLETLPISQPTPPGPQISEGDSESSTLLDHSADGDHHVVPYARSRPTTRVWYGRFKVRYKVVDAINYYEEQLRRVDDKIKDLRQKDFEACPLAFITMDSVASCQMAVQAVLDSSPLQLLANNSPAPADVVWPNTYLPRNWRIFRAWTITIIITLLTIFWSVVLVPIAGLIDLDRIRTVLPSLADMLSSHPLLKSLVQTQLPTLVVSLLNVLVPYLYDWLSNQQGMISQGDVELSVISKNFFFTYFNFFIIFTALGTAAMTPDNLGSVPLRDTANQLALSIQDLRNFYVNYIILQGLGLFPFRLLEFGSVALYPIGLIGAKTPRGTCTQMWIPREAVANHFSRLC
jgi:calcium permeable stress-gated cation channel